MVSAQSPFAAGCDGVTADGTLYVNSEVEPYVAVNPQNTNNVVGVWQQDRWSTGGARGLLSGASFDGGKTWSNPATLILDGSAFFNDKETITADPTTANFVYAVWDRVPSTNGGPAMFARSIDAGSTWQTARSIYDPGTSGQTLGNEIVVLPDGTLVNLFTRIDTPTNGGTSAEAMIVRSIDKGTNWSAPIKVADLLAVGAKDPETGAPVRDGADLPQMAVSPSGVLYMAWADARFSGGAHDAIALTHSSNGGMTWSAPVRVNGDPSAEAFQPSVHVRSDGTISVTYFDLRNNTTDPATLPTILWLTRSTDAINWHESAVAGPFDLKTAPNAEGLFVGDYQGLSSLGSVSEPFFVQANSGNLNNRTDVFSAPAVSVTTMFNLMVRALGTTARPAPPFQVTADFSKRISDNLGHVMKRREAEWRNTIRKGQGPPPLQP